MQKIQMTRTQIVNALNDFQIWEPNIRAALAAAMRDCGAQSIVQTKSAFASGNGEESRRAKGRFVGTFAELKADAVAVRAAVDSADRKAVGARKYDAMMEAAEWLEDCVESYTNTYIRRNNVEVIAEEEAAPAAQESAAPAAEVVRVNDESADEEQVALWVALKQVAAEDKAIYEDAADYNVGYGKCKIVDGDFIHTYEARTDYAPTSTLRAEYGTFFVNFVWSGFDQTVIVPVGEGEEAAPQNATRYTGWAAYATFAQGVGKQYYAVSATPAGAVRLADEALKAEYEYNYGPLSEDDEECDFWSADAAEFAAAEERAEQSDDDWGSLSEMDEESDLTAAAAAAPTAQVVPAPQSTPIWGSAQTSWNGRPAAPSRAAEPTEEMWAELNSVEMPYSAEWVDEEGYAHDKEEAAIAAAEDCDPYYEMSEDRRAYQVGEKLRADFHRAFAALSPASQERVWSRLPQIIKDRIGRP